MYEGFSWGFVLLVDEDYCCEWVNRLTGEQADKRTGGLVDG